MNTFAIYNTLSGATIDPLTVLLARKIIVDVTTAAHHLSR